jgi:Electron transfer DM13
MDVTGAIKRHPGRTAMLAIVGLTVAVAGFLWFRPDRLFTEERVNEALPRAPAAQTESETAAEGDTAAGEASASTLAEGKFISLEHDTTGRAVVLETADGSRFLRFEDFETSNGPDLLVYLSSKAPTGTDDWYGYDQDFVDLGVLKGNIGNQNYELPAGVDLDRYGTAVVWCRRFEVGFAAATLS